VFEGNSEKAAENCEIITIQDLLQLKGRQLCLGATVNKAAENCELITIQDLLQLKGRQLCLGATVKRQLRMVN